LPTTLTASEREIFSVLFSCCYIPPAPCSNYLPLLIAGFGDLDGGYTEAKKQADFRRKRKRRLKPHPFLVNFRLLISRCALGNLYC
jgi:hypothetical protein